MTEADSITREFLAESQENLDLVDRSLVALEREPGNRATLSSIFRTVHTIKGNSGFLGYRKLGAVAHAAEDLLHRLREGELLLSQEMTSGLLATLDAVREMLAAIQTTGTDGDRDYPDLIERLRRLAEPPAAPAPPAAAAPVAAAPAAPAAPAPAAAAPEPAASERDGLGEILVRKGRVSRDELAEALRLQDQGDPGHVGEILVDRGLVRRADVVDALKEQSVTETRAPVNALRVDVGLLDKLMNLVGELVLTRNELLRLPAVQGDGDASSAYQRLNLITSELQEGVMKTRMQHIGSIWTKFPRVVRDLALACGKRVRLEMEGEQTELDKSLIEAIKDPLTHIVRNCVDHGIELPEKRAQLGKPEEGRILIRAFHAGGLVNIEISDDGAGIDVERIKQKALQQGLLSAGQAARLSDREAIDLLFLPGFSTVDAVSSLSGRGVGMDVVKTNIERIGGSIDVGNRPGAGTTLRMKIPLTLAIIPALIVTDSGERYAIPQVSLLELVRLEGARARTGIERLYDVPVYRLRGNLLPLVYLSQELGLARPAPAGGDEVVNIVVLQAGDCQFGLVVEDVSDTEEIVVKPLARQLQGNPHFAGATIMGDGRVALILDVLGVAKAVRLVAEERDRALADAQRGSAPPPAAETRQSLLLLRGADDGRLAIPLSHVSRLEYFPRDLVERAGGRDLIQYRHSILPLVDLAQLLPERRSAPRHPEDGEEERDGTMIQVVVYASGGASVGLVVDRMLDIVEEPLAAGCAAGRSGVLYSAVIQGRITEVLDMEAILAAAGGVAAAAPPRRAAP
ncbi:MAG TPA: chemotaxis protein CheW [Polyangia bacterium]|jgi:two-component system chemotaxis sensor kinase CheA